MRNSVLENLRRHHYEVRFDSFVVGRRCAACYSWTQKTRRKRQTRRTETRRTETRRTETRRTETMAKEVSGWVTKPIMSPSGISCKSRSSDLLLYIWCPQCCQSWFNSLRLECPRNCSDCQEGTCRACDDDFALKTITLRRFNKTICVPCGRRLKMKKPALFLEQCVTGKLMSFEILFMLVRMRPC